MAWHVVLKDSVLGDLRWFGAKEGRRILQEAEERLAQDPQVQSRNMKTLRPNAVGERELRLFGKYRVLFNVDATSQTATIMLVGEKRGDILLVQGEEFEAHHEGDSTK